MKKVILGIILFAVAGVVVLAGNTLAKPIPEPAIMLRLGTGLISIAGIIK